MPELNMLLILAVAVLVAYIVKSSIGRTGIPIVTGYVIVGVVLGGSLLRIFPESVLNRMEIVNDFALGLIGFTIGSELRREVFQKLGKSILLIAVFEAGLTFLLVSAAMWLLFPSLFYQAIILGAVASATAPAATVYVIQQYKSRGPLTSTILAVVGIDDAIALVIFVFASAAAKGILITEHVSVLFLLFKSVFEIFLSVLLGLVSAWLFHVFFKKIRYPDDLTLGIIAFILINLGVAEKFHLSGLLSVMAFGSFITNINTMLAHRSSKILDNFSPILFACFFIFGGAHLDFSLFPKVGLLGLVYFSSRTAGKIVGASIGAGIGKAPEIVKKYVGFTLIPQVGVAIALAIIVKKEFGGGAFGQKGDFLADIVINVLLFTTIVTEIVGPLMTKWVLTRSGERQTSEGDSDLG